MTEKQAKLQIVEKIDSIAKAISQGKDVVISKNASGITVKKHTVEKM